MQPMTLMFKVGGVDYSRAVFPGGFGDTFALPKGDLQSLGKKHLPFPAGGVLLYKSSLPGVVTCNMSNCIDVDGTNADDLTKATRVCRSQLDEIVAFLREYVPGYENCYLLTSASIIGVRETRHFKGEAVIGEEDIRANRVFKDWAVTKASFHFDMHSISGAAGRDPSWAGSGPETVEKGYTIPYGCFVPLAIDGLFLAGRNISGTHKAHSSYRVMPICANMGQSVGIAASLCVKQGIEPRKLSVEVLQKRLTEVGVIP
jgi:hypothetical protein